MSTLADFDEEVGGKFDVTKLPDGDYEMEVDSAAYKDTKAGPLVTFTLSILGDTPLFGQKVEKSFWLTKKNDATGGREKDLAALGRMEKDLSTMGFDVENWTPGNGRPRSQELPKALKIATGIHLKVKKVTKDNKHHNLYINERASGDEKPEKFGPEELNYVEPEPFSV